jgi:hypothetical protein
VSIGLSARALAKAMGLRVIGTQGAFPTGWRLARHVAAPFLAFLGWALVALGLILPFGLLQICHGPCGYPWAPWVLNGIPSFL